MSILQPARAHPLHGVACHLSRVLEIKLFLDVRAMGFHRLRTEVQRFRNRLYFFAFADALENFQFAIGQRIGRIRAGRGLVRTTFEITSLAMAGLR